MLFPRNLGSRLSIDETELTNGELHTIVTNKAGHGKKGALLAMAAGTKSDDVGAVLCRIPSMQRRMVSEVTLDLSPTMERIVRMAFPAARLVSDRFHVQQLVSEALGEMRVRLRREAMKAEAEAIVAAKKEGAGFIPKVYANGDTDKQLLARSKHLLYKSSGSWHESQKARADILFEAYPDLKRAYELAMLFRAVYEQCTERDGAKTRLDAWYAKAEASGFEEFVVPVASIRAHEDTILNYFVDRSTNAGAESFNAKLKNFRALVRGVRDKKFFLFRVAKLYG